jgi:glycosyltransferase involved in cell wall biosynthesis
MKIAIVLEAVFPENKGGLERWYFQLSRELASMSDEVDYLNSSGVDRSDGNLNYKNITKYKWSYLDGGVRSIKQAFTFLFSLIKWTSKNHYDAIYLSSVPIISIFAIPFIKIRSPRTVILVEWLEYWPLYYWISYKGRAIGTISWFIQLVAMQFGDVRTTFIERTFLVIRRRNLPCLRKKTILLPGLVDSQLDLSKSLYTKRTDIVFLGRLVEEKQPILAISIVEKYITDGWTGNFWIMGTGPEADTIRREISQRKLDNQIHLLINPTDEVVNEKFETAFLLLHTSKREGYGLVCVEAAFKGVPTLLINYPENGAVDLQINPQLVATSENISEIVELISLAQNDSENQANSARQWAWNASKNKTSSKSVQAIREKMYFHVEKF